VVQSGPEKNGKYATISEDYFFDSYSPLIWNIEHGGHTLGLRNKEYVSDLIERQIW